MWQLKEKLEKIKREFFLDFDKVKEEKFLLFLNYFREYAKKLKLTSYKNFEETIKLQCLDFYPLLNYSLNSSGVEIGAGAGFLTIPLNIFKDFKDFLALEPKQKRYYFLDLVKNKLNLNYRVLDKRLEESLNFFPNPPMDFFIKALPKKERVFNFLKKIKISHRIFYFSGKEHKKIIEDLKIWYSFIEMLKIPTRENSYVLVFENVSCETWGKL